MRRSLEEISKDIKEIEDFITVTEHVLKQERELDAEVELKRKRVKVEGSPNKENKTPSPPNRSRRNSSKTVTYKINSFRNRKKKCGSPRFLNSRLYFRNGRIGCLEAENASSNVESTHALVKHILKYENEKPLVSPESVRRVLNAAPKYSPPMAAAPPVSTRRQSTASNTTYSLPGQVIENSCGQEEAFEMQPLQDDVISKATGKVLLDPGDSGVHNSPQTDSFGSNSQPLVDEDEQDVQICYDELPELPNEEENIGALIDSEVDRMETDIPAHVIINRLSSADSLDSEGQQFLRDQVRHLVRRFTARANKMKTRLEMPPTPSSSASSPSPPPPPLKPNPALVAKINPSPVKARSTHQQTPNKKPLFVADTPRSNVWLCSSLCSTDDQKTLDPQGTLYISWLCVVSISFLYNAWVIPLRSTFPFQTPENTNTWLILDFCADIVYLVDVVFFKHRIMYLFEGFWVKDKNLTRKNYMRKLQFKVSLIECLANMYVVIHFVIFVVGSASFVTFGAAIL